VLLVSHVASAQPNDDVTKVFQSGVDAYRLGKFDEARTQLEKARALDPKLPGPHRFLAAVGQAQARYADCMKDAYKALELNPRSIEAADTRKLYESCRVSAGRMAAREELGDNAAISVTTNVPGATVKINGLVYGGTPLAPRPITPGPLELEIEKVGWKPIKREVNALPGIVTDLDIELDADPNAPTGDDLGIEKVAAIKVGYLIIPPESGAIMIDDAPVKEAGERIELSPGTHVLELRQDGKDPWRRRVRISAGQKTTVSPMFVETGVRAQKERTGFLVLGAGGAMLAGGFVTAMMSRDAANEARDIVRVERGRDASRPLSDTEGLAAVRTRIDLEDARDRHARFALISNALYAAGIVTTGVGAYFLYKGARQRRDTPPPFAIAPVQGGAVIAKELSW
jgi:hypothetical protein